MANGFGACRAELQDAIAQSVGSKPDGRLKGHKRRRMVRAQFSLQLRLADHRFVFLTLGASWQAQAAAEDTEGAEKAEEAKDVDEAEEHHDMRVRLRPRPPNLNVTYTSIYIYIYRDTHEMYE